MTAKLMVYLVQFLIGMHLKVGESAWLWSDHVFFFVILANAGIQLVTPTRSLIAGASRGLRNGFLHARE